MSSLKLMGAIRIFSGVICAPIIPILGMSLLSCDDAALVSCVKFFASSSYMLLIFFLPFSLAVVIVRKSLITCVVIGILNAILPLLGVSAISLFKTITFTSIDSLIFWLLLAGLAGCGGALFWIMAFWKGGDLSANSGESQGHQERC
jgi:hypothetical protein